MPSTTNFGWTTPADTDLVKDGAAAIRTLGNGIDTSFVDLKGGTTGQVLSKNSNTDLDFTWVTSDDANAIQNAIVDAKGDLITATAADTPARLAVGTNGQYLTADSTTATGLAWAAAPSGAVKQVVHTQWTASQAIDTTTYTDITSGSITITPTSASNSIVIMASILTYAGRSFGAQNTKLKLFRGTDELKEWNEAQLYIPYQNTSLSMLFQTPFVVMYKDSPNTTTSRTYKFQFAIGTTNNSGYGGINGNIGQSYIMALEI